MLMRLNHVIVYCSDMNRSIAFYRDQLGFPVKFESPEWTELHSGSTTIALHIAKPTERPRVAHEEVKAGEAHLGLEVLDIEKFYQENRAYAVYQAKWALIREEIIQAENISAGDQDLLELAERESVKIGIDKERLITYYKSSDQIKDRLVSDKLIAFLLEKSKIKEVERQEIAE